MFVIIFRGSGIYGPDSDDRGKDRKEEFTARYKSNKEEFTARYKSNKEVYFFQSQTNKIGSK